jgi:ribose transport system permease protein
MNNFIIGKKLLNIATKQKAFLAIIAMLVTMLFFDTNFYTTYNLFDMMKSVSILMILAFGVTLVLVAGGCDLSIGGIMVIAGIVVIKMINAGMPIWISILGALLVGAFVGAVNGFLVVYQKTEPFIITLGMGMLLTGIAQHLTDAHPVPCDNPAFVTLANGKLFNTISYLVIVMVAVFLITHWILRYTQFGRNCYAIGGDFEVAKYSGIDVHRIKAATFVICGIAAALVGVMLSSMLNSGSATYGDTTALVVNCGVVVGGTSFAGGIGSAPQSAIGLLLFGVLENGMNMLGIDAYIQMVFKGIVIVAIICLDCYGRKRKRELV